MTNNFFENVLPEKKKGLWLCYSEMKNAVQKSYEYLTKRKYDDAKEIILSYISKRYKVFENLDERVISKLEEYSEMLDNDVKKAFFIIPTLHNHAEVKTFVSELSELLDKKIDSLK